jgi:hypothetical protein
MRHTLSALTLVAVISASSIAAAQPVAPLQQRQRFGSDGMACRTQAASCKLLDGVALNAVAASRTFTLATVGFGKVTVQANLTRTAATDLRLTCTASLDEGASYGSVTSTSIAAGTGTVSAYVDVFAVSGSANVLLEYDVRTYDKLRCVVSGTSGGANDLITIYAIGSV